MRLALCFLVGALFYNLAPLRAQSGAMVPKQENNPENFHSMFHTKSRHVREDLNDLGKTKKNKVKQDKKKMSMSEKKKLKKRKQIELNSQKMLKSRKKKGRKGKKRFMKKIKKEKKKIKEEKKKIKKGKKRSKKGKSNGNLRTSKNTERKKTNLREEKNVTGTGHPQLILKTTKTKTKFGYFDKKNIRITKKLKIASNKLNKSGIFGEVASRLGDALDQWANDSSIGNRSSMSCIGPGTNLLKQLKQDLEDCSNKLNIKCSLDMPIIPTNMENCAIAVTKFIEDVKNCEKLSEASDDEIYACYTSIGEISEEENACVRQMNVLERQVVNATKNCITLFGACKKMEDKVALAIEACSTPIEQFFGKLKSLQMSYNKTKVVFDMSDPVNYRSYRNQSTNIKCADFIVQAKELLVILSSMPKLEINASNWPALKYGNMDCPTTDTLELQNIRNMSSVLMSTLKTEINMIKNIIKETTGTSPSQDIIFFSDRETEVQKRELTKQCAQLGADNPINSNFYGPKLIGGISQSEFWDMDGKYKLNFVMSLPMILKRSILNQFCDFESSTQKDTCNFLMKEGLTDTQRLRILSENPNRWAAFHGETCDASCIAARGEIQELQGMIVDGLQEVTITRQQTNPQQTTYNQQEVKDDPKFLGLNKDGLSNTKDGLEAVLSVVFQYKDDPGMLKDPKQVAIALTGLVATIGPLLGPYGAAAAAIAGPLNMLLNYGTKTGDALLEELVGELTNTIVDEHAKTKNLIKQQIRDQTKIMKGNFNNLEVKISDSTTEIKGKIVEQTNKLIENMAAGVQDIKQVVKDAVVLFSSSNQQQTDQILSVVLAQNKRQLETLQKLYEKASDDSQAFFDVLDELNGLKDKFQTIQVFLDQTQGDHIYDDLSTIMNQVNTFEGSKQLGSTRSWLTRFCTEWENTFLCLDLLSIYVSIVSVRDHVFTSLAATIKKSEHNDADILSNQIVTATQFRQNRDIGFLTKMFNDIESDSSTCLISCYVQLGYLFDQNLDYSGPVILAQTDDWILPNLKGTVLQDGKKNFTTSSGAFLCQYLSGISSNHSCGNEKFYSKSICQPCAEKITCTSGYFKGIQNWFRRYGCKPCNCETSGTVNNEDSCDDNGACFCDSHWNGTKCEICTLDNTADCNSGKCSNGFYKPLGDTECIPCDCNAEGRHDNNCGDSIDGQCSCKPGYTGRKCDECKAGHFSQTNSKCSECSCPSALTQPNTVCNDEDGSCQCTENAVGDKCSKCDNDYYKFKSGSLTLCKECDCDGMGSSYASCDDYTGRCSCNTGYEGLKCKECTSSSYLSGSGVMQQCKPCNCHREGTGGEFGCNNGICECKGDYLISTIANTKCRYMKGFTRLEIEYGYDGGDAWYWLELKSGNQKCETDWINTNWKNSWRYYTRADILGDCKNFILSCNQLIIKWKRSKFVPNNSFMLGGIKFHFGSTIYEMRNNGKFLEVGKTVWQLSGPKWQSYSHTMTCYGTKCDLPNCPGRNTEISKDWNYPAPYEIPRGFNTIGTNKNNSKEAKKDSEL